MSQLHDRTNPEFSHNQPMEIQSPNELLTARNQGAYVPMQTDETLKRSGNPADGSVSLDKPQPQPQTGIQVSEPTETPTPARVPSHT